MLRALFVVLACAGCGKELNSKFCAAHGDDSRCTGETMADGAVDGRAPLVVAHLPVATERMLDSDADITVSATGTVIDTAAGTVTPEWAGAVILNDVAQDDGPDVLVVQVHSLTLELAADVIEVIGDKPLVLVASGTITLYGRINVSAELATPGPGGFGSAMGDGAGEAGGAANLTGDGGGGGGSYQTKGGTGGDPAAGNEGNTYGAATRLEGGSGGGLPSMPGTCDVPAGGGGGAVQVTAAVSLTIAGSGGRINAGGGGGAGGVGCGSDGSGGAGGGAGGMIYLESPMLLGDAIALLGALGGGGGEGSSLGGTTDGAPGEDASTSTAGAGGTNVNSTGGDGGAGATDGGGGDAADPGGDYNGGGGGGGAGWIFYSTSGAAPAWASHPPLIGV